MNVNNAIDSVSIVTALLAHIAIGYIAYRVYRKQEIRPKVWKLIIVIMVALFSFSFDWIQNDTKLRFAILPLGVWLLYFICKGKEGRWQKYRKYAWLGFWSNYILLAASLLALPIHSVFYPKDNLATYISNVRHAEIIAIHPSANYEVTLDVDRFRQQLPSMELSPTLSDQWYLEIVQYAHEEREVQEKFPYMLAGVKSKWGSGISSVIYVEHDGKGLLITHREQQLYYRVENSLLKEAIMQ